MTSVAHADTVNPQQVTDQQAATTLNTVQNNANEVKLSTPAASINVSANTDTKSKAVIDNTVSSTSASSQVEQQAAENTQAVQPTQLTQPLNQQRHLAKLLVMRQHQRRQQQLAMITQLQYL